MVCDLLKQLFNIGVGDSGSLHVLQSLACLNPIRNDLSVLYLPRAPMLAAQVYFVTDEDDRCHDLRVFLAHRATSGLVSSMCTLKEVISPDVHSLIALTIRQVENDYAAISTSIESV